MPKPLPMSEETFNSPSATPLAATPSRPLKQASEAQHVAPERVPLQGRFSPEVAEAIRREAFETKRSIGEVLEACFLAQRKQ